jgi:hypothetical protein
MQARAATPGERDMGASIIGCSLSPHARGIVAVDGNGVRGGVLYDLWTDSAVQCHMWADTPVAWRALIPAVFEYPFLEAGRRVLIGAIRSTNAKSLATAKHLGFQECGRVPDGFSEGVDLVLVHMRREQCRYLKEAH